MRMREIEREGNWRTRKTQKTGWTLKPVKELSESSGLVNCASESRESTDICTTKCANKQIEVPQPPTQR